MYRFISIVAVISATACNQQTSTKRPLGAKHPTTTAAAALRTPDVKWHDLGSGPFIQDGIEIRVLHYRTGLIEPETGFRGTVLCLAVRLATNRPGAKMLAFSKDNPETLDGIIAQDVSGTKVKPFMRVADVKGDENDPRQPLPQTITVPPGGTAEITYGFPVVYPDPRVVKLLIPGEQIGVTGFVRLLIPADTMKVE